jgi:hypothetical protein
MTFARTNKRAAFAWVRHKDLPSWARTSKSDNAAITCGANLSPASESMLSVLSHASAKTSGGKNEHRDR